MKKHIVFVLLMICSSLATCLVFADDDRISIGSKYKLFSQVLEEERELWVSLPDGYGESEERYPVIYLLDGKANFVHSLGLIKFLASNGKIPQMIVVGVVSTDRNRDFTPVRIKNEYHDYPTSGGADRFIQFIKDELFPYIEKRYRVENFRLITGQSFGGLFLSHVMLSQPELFNVYLLASPNLHWIQQERLLGAGSYFAGNEVENRFAFLTTSKDEGITEPLQKLLDSLKRDNPINLNWRFQLLEHDDHSTTPHRTLHQGLEFVFEGWKLHYSKVLESGAESVKSHFAGLSQRYGFPIFPQASWILQYAQWLQHNDKADLAMGMFLLGHEKYPQVIEFPEALAQHYSQAGEPAKARIYFKKCLKLDPGHEMALGWFRENGK